MRTDIYDPVRSIRLLGVEVEQNQTVERLGDRVESALKAIGISQDRIIDVKAALGLPPTCNCPARIEWLNNLDEQLGLSEKLTAFKQAMRWK